MIISSLSKLFYVLMFFLFTQNVDHQFAYSLITNCLNFYAKYFENSVPDDCHSARRPLDDADTLTTLERCFRMIHEQKQQMVPQRANSAIFPGSASSLRFSVTSNLARFLKRPIFDKIKHRQTKLDHNLFDIIWPAMKKASNERKVDEDLNAGVVVPDFDTFVVFQEFLVPLIKDMHCLSLQKNFEPHPKIRFFPPFIVNATGSDDDDGIPKDEIQIDTEKVQDIHMHLDQKWVIGGVVECSRNLDAFELPLNLTIGQLEQSERVLTGKILSMNFANAIGETELGEYYTMNEVLENPSEIRTILATHGLLVPFLNYNDPQQAPESVALNGQFWPYGRGVFVSHNYDLVAWINVQEHLRVLCCTSSDSPADIGMAYSKLGKAMIYLEKQIEFRHSYLLGYLASRPAFLGTSLRITVTLELPHLLKDQENLRQLCITRGLHLKSKPNFELVRLCNMQCMSITEWKLFQDYCTAVSSILQLEKELSMTNSMHIASMLLNIFRKKRHLRDSRNSIN